jgi:hypothetical protein
MKIATLIGQSFESGLKDIDCLQENNSEFIIKYYTYFEENDYLHIVIEYCQV